MQRWKTEAIEKCDVMVYTKIFLNFPYKFWPCGPGKEFFIYAHERRGYYTFWQVISPPCFCFPSWCSPFCIACFYNIEWNLKTIVYIWNFLTFSRQWFDHVPVPTCLAFKISNNSNSRPTFSLASQLVKRLHEVDILFPIENTHTACCLAT